MHMPHCRRPGGANGWRSPVTHACQYLRSVLKRRPSQQFIDELCTLAPVGTYAAMAEQILDSSPDCPGVRGSLASHRGS